MLTRLFFLFTMAVLITHVSRLMNNFDLIGFDLKLMITKIADLN